MTTPSFHHPGWSRCVVVLLVAAACNGPDVTSPPDDHVHSATPTGEVAVALPILTGRIAFVSNRPGHNQIYVMNANGTAVTRLTNDPAADGHPSWAPDGTRITFARSGDIYVMNANGSGIPTRVTSNLSVDRWPGWSPVGTKIVLQRQFFLSSFFDIHVVNLSGTSDVQITHNRHSLTPAWSGDGKKVAFVSAGIYVVNGDGSGTPIQLTTGSSDATPAWSPTGSRIAFVRHHEIYVMNANGSGVTRLTNNQFRDATPAWSPDGSSIAFESDRDGDFEVYVMNADGSGVIQLTHNSSFDGVPAWGP
jgi:Tol biopolymer transport system component